MPTQYNQTGQQFTGLPSGNVPGTPTFQTAEFEALTPFFRSSITPGLMLSDGGNWTITNSLQLPQISQGTTRFGVQYGIGLANNSSGTGWQCVSQTISFWLSGVLQLSFFNMPYVLDLDEVSPALNPVLFTDVPAGQVSFPFFYDINSAGYTQSWTQFVNQRDFPPPVVQLAPYDPAGYVFAYLFTVPWWKASFPFDQIQATQTMFCYGGAGGNSIPQYANLFAMGGF